MGLFAYLYTHLHSLVEMYIYMQLAHLAAVRLQLTAQLGPLHLTPLSLVTTIHTFVHTMTNRLFIPILITGMIFTVRNITYSSSSSSF